MSLDWDLNPRPSPYQGDALPLSYPGINTFTVYLTFKRGASRSTLRLIFVILDLC